MSIVLKEPLGYRVEKIHGPFMFRDMGFHPKYTRITACFDVSMQVVVQWTCSADNEMAGITVPPLRFPAGMWRSVEFEPQGRYFHIKIMKSDPGPTENVESYLEIYSDILTGAGVEPAPADAEPALAGAVLSPLMPAPLPVVSSPQLRVPAPLPIVAPPRPMVGSPEEEIAPGRNPSPSRAPSSFNGMIFDEEEPAAPPLRAKRLSIPAKLFGKNRKREEFPVRDDRLPGYIPIGCLLYGGNGGRMTPLPKPTAAGQYLMSTESGFEWKFPFNTPPL